MVVRMRMTRNKIGGRRSHDALGKPSASTCEKCGTTKVPHRACAGCGTYRSREVTDVTRRALRTSKKEAVLRKEGVATAPKETEQAKE